MNKALNTCTENVTTRAQRLLYLFPVLLAFLIPFGSVMLSWIIALWSIVAIGNYKSFSIRKIKAGFSFWLLPLFFGMTVLSALQHGPPAEQSAAIEIKLSFLLFPFLFGGFVYPAAVIKRTLMAFVSGCFFATVFLLLRALYYSLQGDFSHFFYTDFSAFIHASYFSMYLLIALVILVRYYPRWFAGQTSALRLSGVYALLLITGILLCASKIGIITFALVFPVVLAFYLRRKYSKRLVFLLSAALLVVMALSVVLVPVVSERLLRMTQVNIHELDRNATESTAVRVLIWQQCLALIKEKPVWGYGVADVNQQLYQRYEQQGLSGALQHHLNAHNQFFQTTIGMGVIGFWCLLEFTVAAIIRAIKQKRFVWLMFSFIITLNFLVESMLQAAAGAVFVAFAYYLIILYEPVFSGENSEQ